MKVEGSSGPMTPRRAGGGTPGRPEDQRGRPMGWVGSLGLVLAPFVVFALLAALDRLVR